MGAGASNSCRYQYGKVSELTEYNLHLHQEQELRRIKSSPRTSPITAPPSFQNPGNLKIKIYRANWGPTRPLGQDEIEDFGTSSKGSGSKERLHSPGRSMSPKGSNRKFSGDW
eukprot:gnl/MRDRNA2_/MRDRNA2_137447_c0_seq1.p1 gnl/MRDRNA2_/MRDRNA2_137447_c0~~gnl/MRDRNA2_/MRDRNA2_137447_c0_seq1.p1  ORF type:complete len:113 (+),score=13.02 gnl/MRDRNA2_/MRDRNA2_137447_c0_seq1:60-398(+)